MQGIQIADCLRHLKQATAHLHDASLALGHDGAPASAVIDQLLRGVMAEIRRLEELRFDEQLELPSPEGLPPQAGLPGCELMGGTDQPSCPL